MTLGIRGCDIDRAATVLALQSLLLTVWESDRHKGAGFRWASKIRQAARCVRYADFL
jgi:hypothetical protein